MKTTAKQRRDPDVCGTAVLGERGQVVIPKETRERLHLRPGDSFLVMAHNEAVVFLPKKRMAEFVKLLTAKLDI